MWRESVEALLVVGILYAWLKNGDDDARRGLPYLWARRGGRAAGGGGAGRGAGGFHRSAVRRRAGLFPDRDGADRVRADRADGAVDEAPRPHAQARHGSSRCKRAQQDANWWGVALLVALAIAREGSETVIFLYGLGFGQSGHVDADAVSRGRDRPGLAFLTFYLLQLGGKIFSWRLFFRVTEIMLLFLAAGLFQTGVDKLIDKEILPVLVTRCGIRRAPR